MGRQLVDPRTALQVLEYADLAGAASLRAYCLAVAVCNLDTVLIEARGAFEDLPPHLLAEVEGVLHAHLRSTGKTVMPAAEGGLQVEHSCGSSSRARDVASSILQPGLRPTAAAPKLSDISDDEDGLSVMGRQEVAVEVGQVPSAAVQQRPGSSFKDDDTASAEHAAHRLLRSLSKKLQQIEALEARTALGEALDTQQLNKMGQKPVVLSALAALEGGMAPEDVHVMLQAATEQAAAPPVASAAGGSAPASAAKPPKAETPGARGSGTPGTGSSRAKGKTRSRRRLQSETTVLAAELSVATIGTSPEASVPDPLLFAASPPPDRQVPAFGGQPRTHIVGFAASTPTAQPKAAARSAERQPRRTGALSMFLRGELDAPATATAEASSPSGPRAGSPAWAAKPSAPPAAAPLKDILSQQAAASKSTTPRPGTPGPAPKGSSTKGPRSGAQDSGDASASSLRVPLAAFLGGGPAAPAPAPATGPAWGAVSGASPPLSKPSLRQIQEEQESRRKAAAAPPMWGTSPPTTARQSASIPSAWIAAKGPSASGGAGGGAGPSLLGTSPGGSVVLGTSPSGRVFAASVPPQSKWYLPEDQEHEQRRKKSLKAIQAEESAMKELARKYGGANVRIVKSGAPLVKQ